MIELEKFEDAQIINGEIKQCENGGLYVELEIQSDKLLSNVFIKLTPRELLLATQEIRNEVKQRNNLK